MKPVAQKYRHDPYNGIYGDCHSACLASLLELPLDAVPHFNHDGPDGVTFEKRVKNWLKTKNLHQINMIFKCELKQLLIMMKEINPDIFYILGGVLKGNTDHSVICKNDKIVHDPLQSDTKSLEPCIDGYYWLTFLSPIKYNKVL